MKTHLIMPSMPGWIFELKEKTAGYYSAFGKNDFGIEVSCEGVDEVALLKQCESTAFEKELQLKRSPSKFLFDYCKLISVRDNLKILAEFNEKVFGSWIITHKNRRLVFDGRDQTLTLQKKRIFSGWSNEVYFNQGKLSFDEFSKLMVKMEKG